MYKQQGGKWQKSEIFFYEPVRSYFLFIVIIWYIWFLMFFKGKEMYKIRKMVINDYNELITLWKNTDGIGINGYDDSKKAIKKFLERNPNTCFVMEYNKTEIIGTIMGGNDGRRGFIYHLMVKPEHRKNGIGKKLLEKTETSFGKAGLRRINLVVLKKNITGNKFWDENGYEIRDFICIRSKKIKE